MRRPTIALALIVKNESSNLPRLLESVKDCFDEVHVTDTGSDDDTVKVATDLGCVVHHFAWINDFAAARNFAFEQCKTDYICWLDADDVLTNKESFVLWRDNAMGLCDYWLATYDYASDAKGKPVVSFARERVIKNGLGLKWEYFIHEGMPPKGNKQLAIQYATTWKVTHKRTVEDIQKDKFRNLKIFEVNKDRIDHRMRFYYGKELFEAQKPMEAFTHLMEAVANEKLDLHDRQLGIQYAAYSLMQCNQYDQAMNIGLQGIGLAPNRAEYFTIVGDCLIKKNNLVGAIPFFAAAKECRGMSMPGDVYAGPTFNQADAYTTYPRNQLTRIFYQTGAFDLALKEAKESWELFKNDEGRQLMEEIQKAMKATTVADKGLLNKQREIVISTPPQGAYIWDEEIAMSRGMGGSETAAIEMAKHLKKLTGLPVKIFNMRDDTIVAPSGVEYLPCAKINKYFSENEPLLHIAWRHNHKLTNAPTYLWCHDLVTPGVEQSQNFDKMFCLTPFHKRYVMAMQGVSGDKIVLTRNGIEPSKFRGDKVKNVNKVVFPSSPDRGLERAIRIVEQARSEFPELELHVYYGFDNLRKYGMADRAEMLEKMIAERPWVKYHGFTEQKKLAKEMMEAVVWLYPANFIESFCILALEALAAGCYPVAREIGALQDTLREASEKGMATLLDMNCETDEEYGVWTEELKKVLRAKKWEAVQVDPENYNWENVAKEWVQLLDLPVSNHVPTYETARPVVNIEAEASL